MDKKNVKIIAENELDREKVAAAFDKAVAEGKIKIDDNASYTAELKEAEEQVHEIQGPDPERLFSNRKKRRDFYKRINNSRTLRFTIYKTKVVDGKKKKVKKYMVVPANPIRKNFPEKLTWDLMPRMTREQSIEKSESLGFVMGPLKRLRKEMEAGLR